MLCARVQERDPFGPSTSKDAASVLPVEVPDDDAGADEDLDLAWEVAETARIGMEHNQGSAQVSAEQLTETYQLLGDIGAERELFPEAVSDYEKVRLPAEGLTETCALLVPISNTCSRRLYQL